MKSRKNSTINLSISMRNTDKSKQIQGSAPNSYSENNNALFAQLISIFGLFLAVFAGYFTAIMADTPKENVVCLMTIAALLVLPFLSTLTISIGYCRRRDHVVTSKDIKDAYSEICGNGCHKGIIGYLPNEYAIIAVFFQIVDFLFGMFSIAYLCCCSFGCCFFFDSCCCLKCCFLLFLIFIFSISIVVPIIVWGIYYCKYRKIADGADKYQDDKEKDGQPQNTSDIEIAVVSVKYQDDKAKDEQPHNDKDCDIETAVDRELHQDEKMKNEQQQQQTPSD